jgi:hypothetical protein
MLTKHNEIEISVDKPFTNDKLERQKIAENLTLLVQSTNQPFVISIEAPWGWGKTTFIKMWKAHLESLGHTCLYFNAWENDFVEDPLIAFIGEISKTMADKKVKGKIQAQLKKLQSMGGKIARRVLPLTIQIVTQGLLSQDFIKQVSSELSENSNKIADFASELAEEKIKQYDNDKNEIIEFKTELAKFATSLSEGENKKGPLVFFIDELDRCRPDFSIALLERVKHVFNAEGIVFILSIDREQIEQSIKSIYGQGMNSDGYLRRFIDFRLRLPIPSIKGLCNSLYERFQMNEVFEKRNNKNNEQLTLIDTFTILAGSYQFSPRVIEQCFTEMNLILRTTSATTNIFPEILAFLVAVRAYKPEIYIKLQASSMSLIQARELMEEIKQNLDLKDQLGRWLSALIESHILYSYLSEGERDTVYESLKAVTQNELSANDEKKHAAKIINLMEEFNWAGRYSKSIQFISLRLDVIESIMA